MASKDWYIRFSTEDVDDRPSNVFDDEDEGFIHDYLVPTLPTSP